MMDSSEILKELEKINEKLDRIEHYQQAERRRRIIRIAVIALIVIIIAAILVPKIIALVQSYRMAMDKINELTSRIDGIKDRLDSLGDIDAMKESFSKISSIDFGALDTAIEKIQDFMGKLSLFSR